jgi:ATP-dependent helicase HrpB
MYRMTASLPIEEALPRLRASLAGHTAVVLHAPPGAGKTTVVPLALLDEPWLAGRRILILEPRRLAARAAAARMSALLGEPVGGTVGFRIRFEHQVSARTRIEVLTEGILTRRLQADPALEGVGLVIFDEFHERHLHTDLALALTLDARRMLRPDLRVLVMSATLQTEAVARLLGADTPVVASAGRQYPVEIRHSERDPTEPLPEAVARAVREALAVHPEGDVLAFLPGGAEIRRAESYLREMLPARAPVDVYPLYGDLPWAEQQRAIEPSPPGRRKVVLATPIAETSLTIEGVRIVVDSGYARVPQFDPASGLTRLVTQRISQASAAQRAGRAGRTAAGVCYRLWSEATHRGLLAYPLPEIKSADLAPLALELAAWGAREADSLAWLDPPPPAALAQARALLRRLEALDAEDRITEMGREMARLPLHPRLAHMAIVAKAEGRGALACDLAALLSERDILSVEARRSCDITLRLEALAAFRKEGRRGAQHHGADPNACERVNRAAHQYRRLIGLAPGGAEPEGLAEAAGGLLACAYPDRIAQRRTEGSARYLLSSGRGARLPEAEQSFRPPYLVAVRLDAGATEGLIQLAAPITAEALRAALAAQIQREEVVTWDEAAASVVARRSERLGALVLESAPLVDPDPEKLRRAMLEGVRRLGIAALPWTPAARQWQARVLSLRRWFPDEGWPDVSDAALGEALETWLGPHLEGLTRREHLARLDLAAILGGLLDWERKSRLEALAPERLAVPSGSRLRLEYFPTGESPVLAVKLQELFGLVDTPRIAAGRIPVTLRLLSPAGRPIQVTQDLRSFWERTYPQVRKELKGRYPKHHWPEDPWRAEPTAHTKAGRC